MWDDFDAGSGIVSKHVIREISWTKTSELLDICKAWLREEGSPSYELDEEAMEEDLVKDGFVCVGEMGSQQSIFYYVVLHPPDDSATAPGHGK